MLLSGSPEDKYMKKRKGKKNQIFSSIDEAGIRILRPEVEQKNRYEYFIKMHNCLNFGLCRKLFLGTEPGKFEL